MTDDLDLRAARARDDLTRAVDEGAPEVPPVAGMARRATRRRARSGALAVAAVLAVGFATLWSTSDDQPSSKVVAGRPDTNTTTTAPPGVALNTEAPPPIALRADSGSIEVGSHAFCWFAIGGGSPQGVCADGSPPAELPDIGTTNEIELTAPWASEVTASTHSPGQPCSRSFPVPVDRRPDGTFRLRPTGYPGTSDVRLSAKGPNGSADYLFRWTTAVRGPLPEPSARTSISDRAEGAPLSGIELAVDQLARTPRQATATVKVTAANGRSTTLEAVRAPDTCRAEGSVYWNSLTEESRAPVPGPAPFRYDVTVVLDGVTHTASAVWPDDQIVGFEPNVALHFEPPLAGLS